MKTPSLYSGAHIGSILNIEPEPPELFSDQPIDPLCIMFHSCIDALAWNKQLNNEQLVYLHKIDHHIANLSPGLIFDISKNVKPENLTFFYKCLSYVILGANLFDIISFNENFTTFKRNPPIE